MQVFLLCTVLHLMPDIMNYALVSRSSTMALNDKRFLSCWMQYRKAIWRDLPLEVGAYP
jgi:hypothetical protein